jgi:hypothetical protein
MNPQVLRLGRFGGVSAVVALLMATVTLVPTALAAKPTVQQFPFEQHTVVYPCGFPVQLDGAGKVVDISYTDPAGNFHDFEASPQASETLTNLTNGKSIVINISGPANYTFGPDGSFALVGTGNWFWSGGDPATLAPGLFLTSGRFVFSLSASGVPSWTSTGAKINLCDQLA